MDIAAAYRDSILQKGDPPNIDGADTATQAQVFDLMKPRIPPVLSYPLFLGTGDPEAWGPFFRVYFGDRGRTPVLASLKDLFLAGSVETLVAESIAAELRDETDAADYAARLLQDEGKGLLLILVQTERADEMQDSWAAEVKAKIAALPQIEIAVLTVDIPEVDRWGALWYVQ